MKGLSKDGSEIAEKLNEFLAWRKEGESFSKEGLAWGERGSQEITG